MTFADLAPRMLSTVFYLSNEAPIQSFSDKYSQASDTYLCPIRNHQSPAPTATSLSTVTVVFVSWSSWLERHWIPKVQLRVVVTWAQVHHVG